MYSLRAVTYILYFMGSDYYKHLVPNSSLLSLLVPRYVNIYNIHVCIAKHISTTIARHKTQSDTHIQFSISRKININT